MHSEQGPKHEHDEVKNEWDHLNRCVRIESTVVASINKDLNCTVCEYLFGVLRSHEPIKVERIIVA